MMWQLTLSFKQKKIERNRPCGRVAITDFVHRLSLISVGIAVDAVGARVRAAMRATSLRPGFWGSLTPAVRYHSRVQSNNEYNSIRRHSLPSRKGKSTSHYEAKIFHDDTSATLPVFPYTTTFRWRSQHVRNPRKKESGRPRQTSSRTDRLFVRLNGADSTLNRVD